METARQAMHSVKDAAQRVTQRITGETPVLTSNFGQPAGNVTHALNINGYVLASDVSLMEKQQTFNRGKTLERMVHPCGAGAHGYFQVTKDMTRYCKAKFLENVGKQTPVFVRFSTVTLGKEFPDSARNPRGFAIKFYTEDGNYDLVGLNFPIFFVRDPALGPDVIRSQQRNPENFLLNLDSLFDFASLVPESQHALLMMFSDYGTPYGFRQMHGYGCHTFKWVNANDEEFYVKYHFICESGSRNMNWDEARRMCGEDPDFAKRDLWRHIENGGECTWKCCVQIMPVADASSYRWDPFDVTKVWPRSDYPMIEFGRLVLNKNPQNYHMEVEQVAFSPGSLVPGIEPSPDPLLQFRMFFYRDAQLHRLGVNLHQVPINCPFHARQMHPMSRDGAMRTQLNGDAVNEPHYYPNSSSQGPKADPSFDWRPVTVSGTISRTASTKHEAQPDDDLAQARQLFCHVMDDMQRDHLFYNIADQLKLVRPEIITRSLIMFYKIHPDYARGVMNKMAGNMPRDITFEMIENKARTIPELVDRQHGYVLTNKAK